MSTNITWHGGEIGPNERRSVVGHGGAIVWLTGLSGSGKSTIARALESLLVHESKALPYVLDGDNVRHGLNGDLGFGERDRSENIRRVGEVSKLMADANLIVITALISPFRTDRERVRIIAGTHPFLEVHVATSLEECERRDPKGLYVKARAGQIRDFTGIDSPYEAPEAPELRVGEGSVEASARAIVEVLKARGVLSR